jgi:hypothetical protein
MGPRLNNGRGLKSNRWCAAKTAAPPPLFTSPTQCFCSSACDDDPNTTVPPPLYPRKHAPYPTPTLALPSPPSSPSASLQIQQHPSQSSPLTSRDFLASISSRCFCKTATRWGGRAVGGSKEGSETNAGRNYMEEGTLGGRVPSPQPHQLHMSFVVSVTVSLLHH